jgi:AP-3 complex subunit beta
MPNSSNRHDSERKWFVDFTRSRKEVQYIDIDSLDSVTGPAVMVLKMLVQTQLSSVDQGTASTSRETALLIIARLARKIDDIKHAQARACVIWLVGQYAASDDPSSGPEGIAEWAPDVLRKTAKTFGREVR